MWLAQVITWGNILRLVGLAGIVYVTVFPSKRDPSLLVLFGAMVGLPVVKSLDEALSRRVPPPSPPPPGETP